MKEYKDYFDYMAEQDLKVDSTYLEYKESQLWNDNCDEPVNTILRAFEDALDDEDIEDAIEDYEDSGLRSSGLKNLRS